MSSNLDQLNDKAPEILPRTPEEYRAYLAKKLNWFECFFEGITGSDERLDLTNLLLMEVLKNISTGIELALPPVVLPALPFIKYFALDTARPAPGVEVLIPGDTITAFTNGSLAGVFVRIEDQGADPIPLAEFNPYPHPIRFTKFYLETIAQAGKYLRLHIGSGAGFIAGIADLSVHIESLQKIGMYAEAEWASKLGDDRRFKSSWDNKASGESTYIEHSVPTGKVLYINALSGVSYAYADADKDLNQFCVVQLLRGASVEEEVGGNGGVGFPFGTPVSFVAGEKMRAEIYNFANHNTNLRVTALGHEVNA